MSRKRAWRNRVTGVGLAGILVVLSACSTTVPAYEAGMSGSSVTAETVETISAENIAVSVSETASLSSGEMDVQESPVESVEGTVETTMEVPTEAPVLLEEKRLPAGHQIIYSDGEIYGWTRYEYDEFGRKDMIIFISPTGSEYWSPVFYDGNGHAIQENVGTYSVQDENGLHLEVGNEDNRGRRTPMVQYQYDERGNLTDYWYMYVSGKFLRHIVYSYDSRDYLILEELYYAKNNRLESYVEYIYNGQGQLIRKNEVEDARKGSSIIYTLYQYDEAGRLSREEKIWGGRTHDYVDYYYNDTGELTREYHFLEDKMMGGPYTVEYLFEAIDDSAG